MPEMKEQKCLNCGAPLRRGASRCEYCDTFYKVVDDVIRVCIHDFVPGTKTIFAQVNLEHGLLERHPEEGMKYAKDKLAHVIAKELLQYMTFTISDNPCDFYQRLRGKIEVVVPAKVAEGERFDELAERFRQCWGSSTLRW